MRSILFGNGLNIKFGGKKYSNEKIIRRGIGVFRQDKKIYKICPPETLIFLERLYKFVPDIISGLYDDASEDCLKEVNRFKKVYGNRNISKISDIGMEDYFLVLHVVYKHNWIANNVDEFSIRGEIEAAEMLRDLFLIGIYNLGKINKLYEHFSEKFVEYINGFDNVFTTNYDSNLDEVYEGEVYHLHGQFNVLAQEYNPNSFRNSLSDKPFESRGLINLPGYEYLHSTALMNYSGQNKFNKIMSEHNLNELTLSDIAKLPVTDKNAEEIRLTKEAIDKMNEDPNLKFQEYKGFERFLNLDGDLVIVGLSAMNDNHVFSNISKLSNTYFYYSNQDKNAADKIMPQDTIFKDVSSLWNEMNC